MRKLAFQISEEKRDYSLCYIHNWPIEQKAEYLSHFLPQYTFLMSHIYM